MRYFIIPCLLLSVMLTGFRAEAADSGKLKWKLKAGDTFYLENVQKMDQTITANGRNIDQKNNQTSVARFSIKSVTPDGGAVIEQTILKISSEGNLPGLNSDELSNKLEGVKFTITLDSDHQVTKFEGYDEFVKKVSGGNPAIGAALRTMVPEETLQQTASETFSQLPGKVVATGDTWKRTSKFAMGPIGDMNVNANYTYKGKATVDGTSVDRIDYDAKMTYSPPKAGGGAALPFSVTKGTLKSDEFSGTTHFDPETGRVVNATVKMKLSGDLTFSIQGQDQTMSLKQEMTVTSRVLKENPLDE